ncbi:SRPBCC family protein [Cellulomonas humilata]|uniref:SRPBCC family protein n=1 Tax=Cellulomonas humilata TaxID=144055 RepID=A0A7Y6A2C2_9CELL|nr:SRPBCC family protein [Cellulomonas humilata]NUU17580.1 SRPBCC family protein [Cellulomonas humilata]
MSAITVAVDVERSAPEVFGYATDPTRFHEWQQGVVSGEMEQPGVPQVGARCRTARRIGGATRASTSVVTHVHPGEHWGVRGIDGPIRAVVDVTVEPLAPELTRVTISVDFEGHGLGRLLVPLVVRRQAAAEMPENLQLLKRRLELPDAPR